MPCPRRPVRPALLDRGHEHIREREGVDGPLEADDAVRDASLAGADVREEGVLEPLVVGRLLQKVGPDERVRLLSLHDPSLMLWAG